MYKHFDNAAFCAFAYLIGHDVHLFQTPVYSYKANCPTDITQQRVVNNFYF